MVIACISRKGNVGTHVQSLDCVWLGGGLSESRCGQPAFRCGSARRGWCSEHELIGGPRGEHETLVEQFGDDELKHSDNVLLHGPM